MSQQVFGPDQRDGKWYFYAYVNGQQVEWGPYRSEEFARGARNAIERRINGQPPRRQDAATQPPAGPDTPGNKS